LGGSVGREGSVGRRVGIVVGVCAVVGRFGVIGTRRRRRSVGVNDEAGDDDSGASPRYEPDGGIVLIAVNQEYSRRERGKSGRMGRPSSSSSAGRSPMLFIFVPFYRSSKCLDVSLAPFCSTSCSDPSLLPSLMLPDNPYEGKRTLSLETNPASVVSCLLRHRFLRRLVSACLSSTPLFRLTAPLRSDSLGRRTSRRSA
jgi:hypothetical protein